jgi:A/G-specific adenine glycosylase
MAGIVTARRSSRERRRRALSEPALAFRRRLLRWYGRHRRDLPWRGSTDPYAVLVSEIMLQQTQVSRVEDYFRRFLGSYPTLEDLAAAPAEAVRESWAGLGYYARARNLQAAARHIVGELDGVFPRQPDDLRRLPGIGRYTAAAVASLAFGADVATVDTNIDRVLGRVFRVRGAKKSSVRDRRIWALAERLVPPRRSSDWNQALMDLGATICTARAPRCEACPVAVVCRSRQGNGRNHRARR